MFDHMILYPNNDKLISNILSWTPMCEHTSVGLQAKTYIYQLCADTRSRLEDCP